MCQDSTKELTVVISYVAMLLLYIIDLIWFEEITASSFQRESFCQEENSSSWGLMLRLPWCTPSCSYWSPQHCAGFCQRWTLPYKIAKMGISKLKEKRSMKFNAAVHRRDLQIYSIHEYYMYTSWLFGWSKVNKYWFFAHTLLLLPFPTESL